MQAASDGGPLAAITQNKKAMIGIGVAAVLAIVILLVQVFQSMAPPAAPAAPVGIDPAAVPGGMAGAAPGMDPMMDPAAGGVPGAMPGEMPGGMPGMPGMPGAAPGAAPAAASTEPVKKQPPGVPVRANPFEPNRELAEVLETIPKTPEQPDAVAPDHDIYAELYQPKSEVQLSDDETDGPPIPSMRVTGIILGNQVSALMQIGSEFMQVTPGKWIPNDTNPIYRVERIEQGKVVLTRRWEEGNRKGVQRIEVGIAGTGGQGRAGGYRPGAPGMMAPGMGMAPPI